jgi:hypothetical protein
MGFDDEERREENFRWWEQQHQSLEVGRLCSGGRK